MRLAAEARRKAGSQRWSPNGSASPWPIFTAKRFRLSARHRSERLNTRGSRLQHSAVTGSLNATITAEAGAKQQSP